MSLIYLQGYPENILEQVQVLIDNQRLAAFCSSAIPIRTTSSATARFMTTQALKNRYMRSAPPVSKVIWDNKIKVMKHALGLHTAISRVQGGNLKAKAEIRISTFFRLAPEPFLRMIVVHELAHLKERSQQSVLSAVLPHGTGLPPAGVRRAPVDDRTGAARQRGLKKLLRFLDQTGFGQCAKEATLLRIIQHR